jgi:hypothetical protein
VTTNEHAKFQADIAEIGKKRGEMMSMPEKFARDN